MELFKHQMIQIFGDEDENTGVERETETELNAISGVYFKKYRLLDHDGNAHHATAIRGDKYFMFDYLTS